MARTTGRGAQDSQARARELDIRVDGNNFRLHPDDNKALIKKSLEEHGAGRSIVVDNTGASIAGSGVLEQADKLGIRKRIVETDGSELVVVVRTDISPDDPRRKAMALADNATTDRSAWDAEALAANFEVPELQDWGVVLPDLGDDGPIEGKTEPDAVPEAPARPDSRRGAMYRLGNHVLMCGDATDASDVARLMGGGEADLWLTDPPYNVNYEGGTADRLTIANDDMGDAEFREFLASAFAIVAAHLKPGASFYVFHADSYNFRGACRDARLQVRQCLIWKKNSLVLGRQDYKWIHEPILYGWKDGKAHRWFGDFSQTTVLEFPRPARSELHPTMKPVAMLAYLIGNSSARGETVIDTFGGSGSALVACEQTGRVCRMMELDEAYCDVIRRRWAEFVHGEGCDWRALAPEAVDA